MNTNILLQMMGQMYWDPWMYTASGVYTPDGRLSGAESDPGELTDRQMRQAYRQMKKQYYANMYPWM